MEGSGKWLSPSKSTAIPKPSSTGENDENDSSQGKMIPKSHNQKKTTASKHFMSPTISAASKAAPPKKKILSERNENLSSSDVLQIQRTSFSDRKSSPRNSIISQSDRHSSRIISPYDRASEFGDDLDTDFVDNSSVKAYDPVKNYLSPRPKYLRFNPNRRHEIFNRLEKEESDDSFDSLEVNDEEIKGSSVSPSKESVVNPEKENKMEVDGKSTCHNDHEEEEEEDEEEIEEEGGLCFRESIKFLLTLIACVLSTAYSCTMNFESPTPTQQAIWKIGDGYLSIKRVTLDVIGTKMHEAAFLKVGAGDDYDEFEEGGFETDDEEENQASTKVQIFEDGVENAKEVEFDEGRNREIAEGVRFEGMGEGVEDLEGVDNVENEESVGVENLDEVEIDKDINREIVEIVEVETVVENLEKVENERGIREYKMDRVEEAEGARSGQYVVKPEYSDQSEEIDKDINREIVEIVEVETVLENLEKVENGSGISEYKTDRVEEGEGARSGQYVVKPENPDQSEDTKTDESAKISEEFDMEIKDSHEESTHSVHEVENEKTGRETSAFIGLPMLLSIILASLAAVTVYRLRRTPRNVSAEESGPVLRSHKIAAVDEKKRVEFIARPSLPRSIQEAPRKLDRGICAPTVELIGEIVVGQARRRRIREYEGGESEETNAGEVEKCGTLTRTALASAQPSGHEYSNLSSSSYGSFTTETKILKKEGAQSGEGGMIEVTPVRRSSRLRSRASTSFMSP